MTWLYWVRIPPLSLMPFGPKDDERIVRAAFAVGILLPELERRVCGLRPAERIIPLGGGGRADLTDLAQVVRDIFLLPLRALLE